MGQTIPDKAHVQLDPQQLSKLQMPSGTGLSASKGLL